mmetsp:Transcript_59466/g.159258  ORF Transcript_59466/g.159258 Transcript_59466/m.159258 type:complete len:823 (-) Transcript_59466:89-2557(-)
MHVLSSVLGAAAPYAKTAGGATAATGAVGASAFAYNRANYMFDNELRFGRYTAGYSFAMKQASMYREDIRDMTALTCSKQDLYHVVGVIFFVLNFQLIMAGRLGVHGPSPPGWLMGLYWCNTCSALMFLVLYNWMSMHASARAQAGGAYMLTRHVRLPIPTPKQLDKARKTGNSFERARATDMFRIPFVAPAPKQDVNVEEGSDSEGALKKSKGAAKQRKIPRWYQADEVNDLHAGEGGAAPSRNSTPEHFELYRGLQQEWWGHDVYARIGMLFFMSHWLTGASLYTMCHAFGELRAIWPAWSCSLIFCTAHRAILKCDIVTDGFSRTYNFQVEKLVPWTPMIAVLGMSLDYSIISPSSGWMAVIYVLAWICYGIHVAWAIRMYDLACPNKPDEEQVEAAGQPWWPQEWWLPQAFQNCVYIVAPPKKLEPGQTCLQQEMKAAKGAKATTLPKKSKDTMPALWAWKLMRGAIMTCIGMWVYMSIGRVIEQVNGERMFLKQEGRVMRWPSHMQPWMTPWSRLGTRNEWCHTGGCDRRLMSAESQKDIEIMQEAQRLVSILSPLADGLGQPDVPTTMEVPVQKLLQRTDMNWASKQQPSLIASSSTGSLVALSRGHEGILMHMQPEGSLRSDTLPFALRGMEGVGEVLGASWGDAGLLLTTSSGALAECLGLPKDGIWPCEKMSLKLPLGGSALATATAARDPLTGKLHAAVTFKGEESSIALFSEELDEWLPAGEVSVAVPAGRAPYLSMSRAADELLISTGDGGILKWGLGTHEPVRVAAAKAMATSTDQTWHAVSSCGGNRFAHLSTRIGRDSLPELLISAH